jgi:pimeloyl-ACP methyl ester carboxylesterase
MGNKFSVKLFIMGAMSLILLAVIVIYAGMNAYLYVFQRNILYFPTVLMGEPRNYGLYDAEPIKLKTADNILIVTWWHKPKIGEPVMVYLHGNKGNLGDRAEKLKAFADKGFGIMAVSWRGYGGSEGSPTEEGLYNDARATIQYLLDKKIPLNDIFLYGESLGSGVAVQMATEFKVRALILEAPYTSISNRAAELYPYIPVNLLLKDRFQSIDKIGKIHIPVLIFHGYLDAVMPINHARRLLQAANEPKEVRLFENKGHTDFDFHVLAGYTHEFVRKY